MNTHELLEEARCMLWDFYQHGEVDLHEPVNGDVPLLCPEDDTCTCPRVAAFNRILHGWTPPEER